MNYNMHPILCLNERSDYILGLEMLEISLLHVAMHVKMSLLSVGRFSF